MDRVYKTQPADEARNVVQGAHAMNPDPAPKLLDFPGLRLDKQGMLVPHSILGTVEGLRNYLESKGETELLKRIPAPQRDPVSEAGGRPHTVAVQGRSGISSSLGNIQSHALQNWEIHIRQRRQQQDFLADLLGRPVENLVMNHTSSVRETQEQRESLNQATPLVHSRYGLHVGSEFWRLPPRYGDEISGITATLTQTEQGRREPVAHVGQPRSILQESGMVCNETPCPTSRTRDQSAYQSQELREVLEDINVRKPDISRLEVIGSCKPLTHVIMCQSPSTEKEEEEEEKEQKKTKENLDPLAQHEDVHSGPLPGPALRFCGQLARWTGNSDNNQGEVGISVIVLFEALTEEVVFTDLKLHNEGSTAIYYSWKRICVPRHVPNLGSHKRQHFYFNSSSGVILPGDTKQVEVIFKSLEPGIKNEMWQLKTHPLLLEGASMQVTFRGIALYQDKTADQRRFIENKLEKRATLKMCQSIVDEVLERVFTQEKPSPLAEVYVTEEQMFLSKNPKLQFVEDILENLKKLWQEVNPKHTWDLSVDTLRQAVLAQPDQEAQEKNLARLNSLYLQLSRLPVYKKNYCTAAAVGRQLWRTLFDRMDDEARWLRNMLGLPQRHTWDVADDKDEKNENKEGAAAKEERNGERSTFKEDKRGKAKSAETEKQLKQTPEDELIENPEVYKLYRRLLHSKVYALVEDLVLNLYNVMEDLDKKN